MGSRQCENFVHECDVPADYRGLRLPTSSTELCVKGNKADSLLICEGDRRNRDTEIGLVNDTPENDQLDQQLSPFRNTIHGGTSGNHDPEAGVGTPLESQECGCGWPRDTYGPRNLNEDFEVGLENANQNNDQQATLLGDILNGNEGRSCDPEAGLLHFIQENGLEAAQPAPRKEPACSQELQPDAIPLVGPEIELVHSARKDDPQVVCSTCTSSQVSGVPCGPQGNEMAVASSTGSTLGSQELQPGGNSLESSRCKPTAPKQSRRVRNLSEQRRAKRIREEITAMSQILQQAGKRHARDRYSILAETINYIRELEGKHESQDAQYKSVLK
eukprot:gb/GECG01006273.1/.p1 GENE.gb/GECG01006273.1/~~gb/GECG01006273.1/.p1  ORF type:complete len:331 (+),score=37.60 gb/GECG01006273.1/:1-993(+)